MISSTSRPCANTDVAGYQKERTQIQAPSRDGLAGPKFDLNFIQPSTNEQSINLRKSIFFQRWTIGRSQYVLCFSFSAKQHDSASHHLTHRTGNTQVKLPIPRAHTDLFERLAWQMCVHHAQSVLLLRQIAHVSVRLPIVQRHRREIVERFVQVMFHVR